MKEPSRNAAVSDLQVAGQIVCQNKHNEQQHFSTSLNSTVELNKIDNTKIENI